MKIAVTGSNGRIGTAVVEQAQAQGHTVVKIDRVPSPAEDPHTPTIQLDVTDYDAFVKALKGCDALIHLAAIPSPGRFPDHIVHNNNVVSNYNALRAAVENNITRVCQASSINAIGGAFSESPQYDYLPLDEAHPTYSEDPYSLSKWICEKQADAFARRYKNMTIASLRIHGVVSEEMDFARWRQSDSPILPKQLWGYTRRQPTARACLLGVTAEFSGHQVFYIVAPTTMMDTPSQTLKQKYYPDVPLRSEISGNQGFFNCQKAAQLLGWTHEA